MPINIDTGSLGISKFKPDIENEETKFIDSSIGIWGRYASKIQSNGNALILLGVPYPSISEIDFRQKEYPVISPLAAFIERGKLPGMTTPEVLVSQYYTSAIFYVGRTLKENIKTLASVDSLNREYKEKSKADLYFFMGTFIQGTTPDKQIEIFCQCGLTYSIETLVVKGQNRSRETLPVTALLNRILIHTKPLLPTSLPYT